VAISALVSQGCNDITRARDYFKDFMTDQIEREAGEMSEKVIKLTLMIDEELDAKLTKCLQSTRSSTSDVVRACIHLGLPLLSHTPLLIGIVPTLPENVNQKATR
jgi:hypothetical protein